MSMLTISCNLVGNYYTQIDDSDVDFYRSDEKRSIGVSGNKIFLMDKAEVLRPSQFRTSLSNLGSIYPKQARMLLISGKIGPDAVLTVSNGVDFSYTKEITVGCAFGSIGATKVFLPNTLRGRELDLEIKAYKPGSRIEVNRIKLYAYNIYG